MNLRHIILIPLFKIGKKNYATIRIVFKYGYVLKDFIMKKG